MTTRLEIAKRKLSRLNSELNGATERAFAHMRTGNGQPMNDKRGGQAFMKRADQLERNAISLVHEIESQEQRVENLERQQWNKENGRTKSGGLATSVENIERLRERITKREEEIANGHVHNYSRRYLNDDKKKLALLIALKERAEENDNRISDKTRELIDSGAVTQWVKKPIYYFVKGLQKVALEIDQNGDFNISKRYPAYSESDKTFIAELLQK